MCGFDAYVGFMIFSGLGVVFWPSEQKTGMKINPPGENHYLVMILDIS